MGPRIANYFNKKWLNAWNELVNKHDWKKENRTHTGNAHSQIWMNSRKIKIPNALHILMNPHKRSECFWWPWYLSFRFQEDYYTTVRHSVSLLSDYRILSFINRSIWLNTMPLDIRYICILNSIRHPSRKYLIFRMHCETSKKE